MPPGATDLKNATIMMVGGSPLYRLPLDGLIVTDLCPTGNGRIFFSADDSLFELEYFVGCISFLKIKKMFVGKRMVRNGWHLQTNKSFQAAHQLFGAGVTNFLCKRFNKINQN